MKVYVAQLIGKKYNEVKIFKTYMGAKNQVLAWYIEQYLWDLAEYKESNLDKFLKTEVVLDENGNFLMIEDNEDSYFIREEEIFG